MQIRKLNGNDIFKMSKILKKLDLKEELKAMFTISTGEELELLQAQIGTMAITTIFENLHKAQDEVNDFLGGLCGCTGKEFGDKDIVEIAQFINEFKNNNDLNDFFGALGQLM